MAVSAHLAECYATVKTIKHEDDSEQKTYLWMTKLKKQDVILSSSALSCKKYARA